VAGASRRSGASAPSMTGNELAVVARLARCGLRPVEQVEGCVSHRLGNPRCRFELETPESSGDAMGGGQRQPHRCFAPAPANCQGFLPQCGRQSTRSGAGGTRRARLDSGTGRDHPPADPREHPVTATTTLNLSCWPNPSGSPHPAATGPPASCRSARRSIEAWPAKSTKRSRLGRIGSLGSKRRTPRPQRLGPRRHRHWGCRGVSQETRVTPKNREWEPPHR
jgi:hypothetical protein